MRCWKLPAWPVCAAPLVAPSSTLPTALMSNAASVAQLIPAGCQLAVSLGQPPLGCMDAVLFSASQSVLNPVGVQTT
jgi:di/tricarboxylate transporter